VLAGWQIRLQRTEHRAPRRTGGGEQPVSGYETGGLPVAVPAGRLPADIRGRDGLLAELRRPLTDRNPARRLLPWRAPRLGCTWVLGENHRSTLETQHLLGQIVGQDNRYSEAEQLLRQVLTERERALGNDHPDTQATRNDIDQIIKRAGK
jgi:hypothetical protein